MIVPVGYGELQQQSNRRKRKASTDDNKMNTGIDESCFQER